MKALAVVLALISIHQYSEQRKSIIGTWIDEADEHSIVKIDKNTFYQIYDTATIFSGKYFRSSKSCDSNYLDNKMEKNLDFISIDDGTCFEITGLTDSTLAYRHTASGKMHVFYKSRLVKKSR